MGNVFPLFSSLPFSSLLFFSFSFEVAYTSLKEAYAACDALVRPHGFPLSQEHHISHGLLAAVGGMSSTFSLYFFFPIFMVFLSSDTCIEFYDLQDCAVHHGLC